MFRERDAHYNRWALFVKSDGASGFPDNSTFLVRDASPESHSRLVKEKRDVSVWKQLRQLGDDRLRRTPRRVELVGESHLAFVHGNFGNFPLRSPVVHSPVVPTVLRILRNIGLAARVGLVQNVIRLRDHIVERKERGRSNQSITGLSLLVVPRAEILIALEEVGDVVPRFLACADRDLVEAPVRHGSLLVAVHLVLNVLDVVPALVRELLTLHVPGELVVGHRHHVTQDHHERRVRNGDILRLLVAGLRVQQFLRGVPHSGTGDQAQLLVHVEERVQGDQFHKATDHL